MNHPHNQYCSNCRNFLSKPSDPTKGYCRAHPPVPLGGGIGQSTPVPVAWWCGEWSESAQQPAPIDQPDQEMPLGVGNSVNESDSAQTLMKDDPDYHPLIKPQEPSHFPDAPISHLTSVLHETEKPVSAPTRKRG